ncbi:hypothetical protein JOC85_001871 [Bacillus mesophilus]|uniref:Uncharacterized protein n=1 Tax=Bacillus mesophilus TaxID=1808955 RepID=A0A6M0Q6K2_9BACI|nr:hypothetical protein [Bacillus mesophilus]MBM7661099.1 hypothetical protein [Bacillus mesophilus]NEY71369.1 hypothetical protein [Bacillus mesophilus]
MRKLLIGIPIMTIIFCLFLVYNHKQLPTKDDVFKITANWSPKTEEVYMVREIDGDWLTIFKNSSTTIVSRLEQNWLGFWEFKDDLGSESSLVSTHYPRETDLDFTWNASGRDHIPISYYFGQINNPKIQEIKIEIEKDIFENALVIDTGGARFFFLKSERQTLLPINIRGHSESGILIYSTVKKWMLK